ncbi:catechol 2,3-dioxygenase-like lactoylglutathione lyase family enzyme [Actinoplanes lutulentus]|uniref:Catechol 2,3-dioxygenase-like lactoylglutathione lyase family enzyme n=1 Tax=Actinoplanes lutulentus TaxID=1287878 RepID=A0A327YYU8_9ACTN|nr:VOC family protein [Actinoplanes lutulentus]MBB2943403.1 catechol 2,3-dioxygenase-like lactoylglutathione lyase family enzyme [Actinoplanes lutulentus]RAK26078.1 catechol 2,3-dioxygenase-like lactoylglutathione lyase family enzyme [Actinoplanes lutulentus]
MIDHVFIPVTDIARSHTFYCTALQELGWREIGNYLAASGPAGIPDLYGFGDASGASVWLRHAEASVPAVHVGFVAPDRLTVDASYQAAIGAGARDNGEPAVRDYFTASYYAGNVFDPDGNSLEFVTKR